MALIKIVRDLSKLASLDFKILSAAGFKFEISSAARFKFKSEISSAVEFEISSASEFKISFVPFSPSCSPAAETNLSSC